MSASDPEPVESLSFVTRLWFAYACFFRVLFDGAFARRAYEAREPAALPAPREKVVEKIVERVVEKVVEKPAEAPKGPPDPGPALQMLALFQREGRFVDFVEQDLTGISDAEIGAVARVVHEGCRKAMREHVKVGPVRSEEEGAPLTLAEGFSPSEVKLSGNVRGAAPYKGTLRHRGWRAREVALPTPVKGHDPKVIAPAEVEL